MLHQLLVDLLVDRLFFEKNREYCLVVKYREKSLVFDRRYSLALQKLFSDLDQLVKVKLCESSINRGLLVDYHLFTPLRGIFGPYMVAGNVFVRKNKFADLLPSGYTLSD